MQSLRATYWKIGSLDWRKDFGDNIERKEGSIPGPWYEGRDREVRARFRYRSDDFSVSADLGRKSTFCTDHRLGEDVFDCTRLGGEPALLSVSLHMATLGQSSKDLSYIYVMQVTTFPRMK